MFGEGGASVDNEEKMANRRMRIIIIALFLVCTVIIAALIFGCIRNYPKYDEDNLDLVHEELTFEKYKRWHSRSGWCFTFYFKEYKEPFQMNSVVSKRVDKSNLIGLTENDMLKVTFCQNFDDICEISCNDVMILSLSDYIKANQHNEIMGIICCLFVFLCVLFLAWVFLGAIEPNTTNAGLGKIRMEYTVKGNVIRVYHSRHVCSLVINDKIFDQHHGIYGTCFCLHGRIGMMKTGGKTIHVEAKMGFSHMRLYCNGQLVAKKFMLFG